MSLVHQAHVAVEQADNAAKNKQWKEAIEYRQKAGHLFRKAILETSDNVMRRSLQQLADDQDRQANEWSEYLKVAVRHRSHSLKGSIEIRSSQPITISPATSPRTTSVSPRTSSIPKTSPVSTSPSYFSTSPSAISPSASPSASPPPPSSSSYIWSGVEKIFDNFFPSSYGTTPPPPSTTPGTPSAPTTPRTSRSPSIHSETNIDDIDVTSSMSLDEFIFIDDYDQKSPIPAHPHYPIPSVSTILTQFEEEEQQQQQQQQHKQLPPAGYPKQQQQASPSLSSPSNRRGTYHPPSEQSILTSEFDYLESLDRNQLIVEVKKLKTEVGNLIEVLQEQQGVKRENDTLKQSIVKFREEVRKNIKPRPDQIRSAIVGLGGDPRNSLYELTDSVLPDPNRRLSHTELKTENEELKRRLAEAELKLAIHDRNWEKLRKRSKDKRKEGGATATTAAH